MFQNRVAVGELTQVLAARVAAAQHTVATDAHNGCVCMCIPDPVDDGDDQPQLLPLARLSEGLRTHLFMANDNTPGGQQRHRRPNTIFVPAGAVHPPTVTRVPTELGGGAPVPEDDQQHHIPLAPPTDDDGAGIVVAVTSTALAIGRGASNTVWPVTVNAWLPRHHRDALPLAHAPLRSQRWVLRVAFGDCVATHEYLSYAIAEVAVWHRLLTDRQVSTEARRRIPHLLAAFLLRRADTPAPVAAAVFGDGSTTATLATVCTRVDGPTLTAVVAGLPPSRVLFAIVGDVCAMLAEFERCGITHGDLSTANVAVGGTPCETVGNDGARCYRPDVRTYDFSDTVLTDTAAATRTVVAAASKPATVRSAGSVGDLRYLLTTLWIRLAHTLDGAPVPASLVPFLLWAEPVVLGVLQCALSLYRSMLLMREHAATTTTAAAGHRHGGAAPEHWLPDDHTPWHREWLWRRVIRWVCYTDDALCGHREGPGYLQRLAAACRTTYTTLAQQADARARASPGDPRYDLWDRDGHVRPMFPAAAIDAAPAAGWGPPVRRYRPGAETLRMRTWDAELFFDYIAVGYLRQRRYTGWGTAHPEPVMYTPSDAGDVAIFGLFYNTDEY